MSISATKQNIFAIAAGPRLRCFCGSGFLVCLAMWLTIAAPLTAQIEIRTLHLARVHGSVSDRTGRPVGDARVYLVSGTDETTVKETRTDTLGKFNLGRRDGSYWLRVEAKGFSTAGEHVIVGLTFWALFHSSRLYVMLGPQACMDDCSPVWTNKRQFEHALRWNNGKFE